MSWMRTATALVGEVLMQNVARERSAMGKIELLADMAAIPGGTFRMGSDRHYPEEAPAHRVSVAPFWMDRTPVTNRQFKQFVAATRYVTVAEIAPDPKDYPGASPHMLKLGSLVFTPPPHAVDLRDWSQWWRFELGADWRHPLVTESSGPCPIIRWCTSPIRTPRPMPRGQASNCGRKRSGSLPREQDATVPSLPGGTNWRLAAATW
jgi:formylglycine-generating enzyme required for sulfatase activity